jgi:hypothetical protein
MANAAYSPQGGESEPRSTTDATPPTLQGTGESAVPAIGSRVRHRLSGATGEVVDHQADPFVKDLTHGVVNWVGDGDGFGQGYSSTSLIKF